MRAPKCFTSEAVNREAISTNRERLAEWRRDGKKEREERDKGRRGWEGDRGRRGGTGRGRGIRRETEADEGTGVGGREIEGEW